MSTQQVGHFPEPGGIASVVGTEIKVWLTRRGLNQTALAMHLGVSQSQMSKRIRGTVLLDIEELTRVAEFLDVPVPTLLGYESTPRPGGGPGGGEALRACRDSNPKPSDPKVAVITRRARFVRDAA